MDVEKQIVKQLTPLKFVGGENAFIIPNYSGLREKVITKKLIIDEGSDTYFKYNSSTSKLELYVNGVIVMDW
jgi:hypothetical protein